MKGAVLCFKLQFCKHQKQMYSFYETSYNSNNVHLAFRCVFGALSDVYKSKISFLPQPWWPTVMQMLYMLTISPLSLNKANLPKALQAGQKGKKNSKASFALINGCFFHRSCLFSGLKIFFFSCWTCPSWMYFMLDVQFLCWTFSLFL